MMCAASCIGRRCYARCHLVGMLSAPPLAPRPLSSLGRVLQDSQSSAMLPAHATSMRGGGTCGGGSCPRCCRLPLLPTPPPPCPAAKIASIASVSAARGLQRFDLLAGLPWGKHGQRATSAALLWVMAGRADCAPARQQQTVSTPSQTHNSCCKRIACATPARTVKKPAQPRRTEQIA